MSQKKGNTWTRNKRKLPQLKDEEVRKYKEEILNLLDTLQCFTISDAAKTLGLSPSQVYLWNTTDEDFKGRCGHAEEVLADEVQKRLLEVSTEQRNMAYVTANVFLLKGLRPKYKDSWRIVEPPDVEAKAFLAELVALGKKADLADGQPSQTEEVKNPLDETIKRLEDAQSRAD